MKIVAKDYYAKMLIKSRLPLYHEGSFLYVCFGKFQIEGCPTIKCRLELVHELNNGKLNGMKE